MPVYEYVCEKCGKTSEALRKMSEADEPFACTHCGSRKTRRAASVFAGVAKEGSGAGGDLPPSPCASCGERGSCAFNA